MDGSSHRKKLSLTLLDMRVRRKVLRSTLLNTFSRYLSLEIFRIPHGGIRPHILETMSSVYPSRCNTVPSFTWGSVRGPQRRW